VLDLRYARRAGRTAIAERIGLKETGVKTLLQRIRARLRACVERRIRR